MRCLIQQSQIHSLNQCRLEGSDPIKKILRHDIIPEKVELINQKKSPIQDDYIEKYLFERIERIARMEGNAGAVVPDEESEPERTGSESGTIFGRDWSTTSSLRRCFQ